MAEWLYEDGIGERRAALIEDGAIIEIRVERDSDGPRPGAILETRLREVFPYGGALVQCERSEYAAHQPQSQPQSQPQGEKTQTEAIQKEEKNAFLVHIRDAPEGVSLGGRLRIRVIRAALSESGRVKLCRGEVVDCEQALSGGLDLLARIKATGFGVRTLFFAASNAIEGGLEDVLEDAGWSEGLEAATSGHWRFDGGVLVIFSTPAMTLIDVDGEGEVETLAITAARAVAAAIRFFDIGGSIGIDFPTFGGRAARQAVAAVIDANLPQFFERTALNGFGFMQIIRPRYRPSLIERQQFSPLESDCLAFLRRAERSAGIGDLTLTVPRLLYDFLKPKDEWLKKLAARTGRPVRLIADANMTGVGHAQ